MKEGAFNSNLVSLIRQHGIFCYKVIDKVHHGVPDIYVQGGRWIESKIIRRVGLANNEIALFEALKPVQKVFIRDLISHGEEVVLAIRYEIQLPDKTMVRFQFIRIENPFSLEVMKKHDIMEQCDSKLNVYRIMDCFSYISDRTRR